MKCSKCGKEIESDVFGRMYCGCNTTTVNSLTGPIVVPIEEATKNGVVQNDPKYKTGVSCLLCGKSIETYIPTPTICEDCKALWKKLQQRFTTKVGSMVVAITKEQDLLGFYGRVLQTRTGEALVEFPMVKGKRVVTWLKDKDYTEVE